MSLWPTAHVPNTTAVLAGSDTAATALAHLCYFLTTRPECHKKLRKEINEYFPNSEEPFDPALHAEMRYLNACMCVSILIY